MSVTRGPRLWGLLVCHTHGRTKFLSYQKRTAILFIMKVRAPSC